MKKLNYACLTLIACLAASCTFAIYVQKNNSDSTQNVENPTSSSVDSTTISIQDLVK